MIEGLIVGHKDIGEGFLRALKTISGSYDSLACLSNDGLSKTELVAKVEMLLENADDDGTVIFVDVYGGSCWQAAKIAKTDRCRIVTGVNLPMLLSFVNKRLVLTIETLAEALDTDGKRGITFE